MLMDDLLNDLHSTHEFIKYIHSHSYQLKYRFINHHNMRHAEFLVLL